MTPDPGSAEALLAAAPAPLVVQDARSSIREALAAGRRRIAVLDDDPTGSQTVHGVAVVTEFDPEAIAVALEEPGATCFVLTNTRSLDEADAVALTERAGEALAVLEERLGGPVDIVSRSDSTLRGHVHAEVDALARTAAAAPDGVLFCPAYLEAGRLTAGDVHWARVDGELVPVGETEFAQDATFGYRHSDLRAFVQEKTGGAEVTSLSLEDIRAGGPDRVAEILGGVSGGTWVVVNATEYADLEVVVLGLGAAQRQGKRFLYRSGPSFVRALAGIEPRAPLGPAELFPAGRADHHGLVVVGSHVGLTSRQVEAAQAQGGLTEVELDVAKVADEATRDAAVQDAVKAVRRGLREQDVLLYTSRTLKRGDDKDASLAIARAVSAAVVDVVKGARRSDPGWVVAKGGITSHDVAAKGLEIRRAEVLGQMFEGIVSVFRAIDAPTEVVGIPYVVFAGNVGDESTLAEVIARLRSEAG